MHTLAMHTLDCAVADSLIRPISTPPLLSIVIPTYDRPEELRVAVASLRAQITDDMAGKIEILIADNASRTGTDAIKEIVAGSDIIGFVIHEENQGVMFQIYSAPYRARGRWTWSFGDDDALADGGLAYIIDILETHQPAFVTINRQVLDPTLTTVLTAAKHAAPDMEFASFAALLEEIGHDQVTFITSQIFETATARSIDPTSYLNSPSLYGQTAWYLEAYHDKPAYYAARPIVKHRWDPDAGALIASNFRQLATFLPIVMDEATGRIGRPELVEAINGTRSSAGDGERRVTFIDNVLENLWRSIAHGTMITDMEWSGLVKASQHWREDHQKHLEVARETYDVVHPLELKFERDLKALTSAAKRVNPAQKKKVRALQEQQERLLALQDQVNQGRQNALHVSQIFR